jgi:hypothetical protein
VLTHAYQGIDDVLKRVDVVIVDNQIPGHGGMCVFGYKDILFPLWFRSWRRIHIGKITVVSRFKKHP